MNLPVRRDPRHRVLGGVCAGLARRWGVDANLLRIALVVLCFSSGLGLVLYGIGVALIPPEGSDSPPIRRVLPFTKGWTTPVLVLATTAAGAVVFGVLGGWSGFSLFPLLVVGALWYLAVGRRGRRASAPPTEPTPYERAATAWRDRLAEQERAALTAGPPPVRPPDPVPPPEPVPAEAPAAAPPPDARRGRRRSLWWVALGLAGAGVAAVALAGPAHPWPAYTGAVLLALGAALVLATRRGRPRLLLPVTILVGAVTLLALAVPAGPEAFSGALGLSRTSYLTAVDLPTDEHTDVGRHVYDFASLTLTADAATRLSVDAGTLVLVLPEGLNTEVTWSVDAGRFSSPEHTAGGFDLSGVETHTPVPGGPVFRIDASTDLGDLEVIRQ